jgi:hypothetical protein
MTVVALASTIELLSAYKPIDAVSECIKLSRKFVKRHFNSDLGDKETFPLLVSFLLDAVSPIDGKNC